MGRSGKELNTVSLKDRKSLIENENWTIGFDGADVWLQQKDSTSYEGNARFYHNLMFYFYAMPFVLGDDGIQYESIPETELMGETYAGIKISYEPEVGDSPEDEYILFYDPETYAMEWLAYTVTFGKDEKSDRFSYIKYSAWENTKGIVLPTQLTWYQVEEGKPVSVRSSMDFEIISIIETPIPPTVFAKPESAVVVDK